MDEYLGIIKLFAGNFAPRGWMYCNGALLAISQNSALFSILGTTYGGDGITTFALPDLRGRVAIGYNAGAPGPGLSNYALGQQGGVESVTLNQMQIPPHNHNVMVNTAAANTVTPATNTFLAASNYLSGRDTVNVNTYSTNAANGMLNPQSISPTGGGQSHENRQPYLALGYIICVEGLYPSRP